MKEKSVKSALYVYNENEIFLNIIIFFSNLTADGSSANRFGTNVLDTSVQYFVEVVSICTYESKCLFNPTIR